ncbi:MAG TPA: chloride channel protein, partial [Nitrosopumilaceae archaeon]|nr:chloride channel protein [Nitrosopumilaceae archaeon]
TGSIALLFFEVSGTGNDFLTFTFKGNLPDFFGGNTWLTMMISLLIIAFLKIVTTTLTIGSGGSAGIFGPSLFIGAMLGAAVGVSARFFLNHDVSIASFMVVGMGAFYAGVANAPIAGIIMIVEMTGSYILLPPLIIVSIFTFILSKRISMYKSQVENRFKSPAHAWDMKFDVIESIRIKDYFPEYRLLAVINKNSPLHKLQKLAADIHASDFVVVNEDLKYEGMLSLRNIKYKDSKENESTLVTRFIDRSVPYVTTGEMLNKALQIITQYDVDKVAVVEDDITVGYIRSKDIFEAYTEHLKKKKDN